MPSHGLSFPFVTAAKKTFNGRKKRKEKELIRIRGPAALRTDRQKPSGWRRVCAEGASPDSSACQVRYLSRSNRGTGEDRQHLLSEPNYLLSTENKPQPGHFRISP